MNAHRLKKDRSPRAECKHVQAFRALIGAGKLPSVGNEPEGLDMEPEPSAPEYLVPADQEPAISPTPEELETAEMELSLQTVPCPCPPMFPTADRKQERDECSQPDWSADGAWRFSD